MPKPFHVAKPFHGYKTVSYPFHHLLSSGCCTIVSYCFEIISHPFKPFLVCFTNVSPFHVRFTNDSNHFHIIVHSFYHRFTSVPYFHRFTTASQPCPTVSKSCSYQFKSFQVRSKPFTPVSRRFYIRFTFQRPFPNVWTLAKSFHVRATTISRPLHISRPFYVYFTTKSWSYQLVVSRPFKAVYIRFITFRRQFPNGFEPFQNNSTFISTPFHYFCFVQFITAPLTGQSRSRYD